MEDDNRTLEDVRRETDEEQDQFVQAAMAKAREMAARDYPKPKRGCRYTPSQRKRNNVACVYRNRRYKFYFNQILERELETLTQATEKLQSETNAFLAEQANGLVQLAVLPPAPPIPQHPGLGIQDPPAAPDNVIVWRVYKGYDDPCIIDEFEENEGFPDPSRDSWYQL